MLVGLRSRKHIPPFDLVRPASVEEACRALATPGRSVVMAGGLDLIDRLKGGEPVDRIIADYAGRQALDRENKHR